MRLVPFAVLALGAAPLLAQRVEIGPYYSYLRSTKANLGTTRGVGGSDSDTRLKNGQGYGLRLTLNSKGYYGHEIHYSRTLVPLTSNVDEFIRNPDGSITTGDPIDRKEKIKVTEFGYNFLMYMMPLGEWWRPFITVGAVSIKTNPPLFPEWSSAGARNFGANYGAGIKLAPSKKFLFRLDWRHQLQGRAFTLNLPDQGQGTGGNISQMEVSAGFSYTFVK